MSTAIALSYGVALHMLEFVPMMAFGIIDFCFLGYKPGDVPRSGKAAQVSRPEDGPVSEKGDMAGKH